MRSAVCLSVYSYIIARLGKHVPAATNTLATVEQLLDAVFSMRSVSYQILNMK
jgi:hypothetical protein